MRIAFSVLLLFALGAGCLSVPQESGSRFSDWWNFYADGKSLMQRGDYQGAAEKIETALGIRNGARYAYAGKDSEKECTYGQWVVEGCFPKRDLGICYFHLGRLEEANAYLERSIKETPSDPAREYLLKISAVQKNRGGEKK